MKVAMSKADGSNLFQTAANRRRDQPLKREALLSAAVQAFNSRGFHGTSMDDVAATLGVTKALMYHYIGNKDDVLFECANRGLKQLHKAATDAKKQTGSGVEKLQGFLSVYCDIIMQDWGRCAIRTNDEMLAPKSAHRFRSLRRKIDLEMRNLIAGGVKDGSVVSTNVRLTTFTLAGSLNWVAWWYRPDGPLSSDQIMEHIVNQLIKSVTP
jgi:AcrR family transcriptional regulator